MLIRRVVQALQEDTIPCDHIQETQHLYSNAFFPLTFSHTKHKLQPNNIYDIHNRGHLWPIKYRKFTFQQGYLLTMADHYNPPFNYLELFDLLPKVNYAILQLGPGKNANSIFNAKNAADCLVKQFFQKSQGSKVFAPPQVEAALQLYKAFIEGLQQNEHLLEIGANYLEHKAREETRAFKEGSKDLRNREQVRGDLLQDYAATTVKQASAIMKKIMSAIRSDKTLDHSEYVAEDVIEIKRFFSQYKPKIENIIPSDLEPLRLINLGNEDVNTVPHPLREIVDELPATVGKSEDNQAIFMSSQQAMSL